MVNQLTVNTAAMQRVHSPNKDKMNTTPRTAASTPPTSYSTVRGRSDIRSPGISKTPSIVKPGQQQQPPSPTSTAQIPDFITQTDKYGNASTPRNPHATQSVSQQRVEHADDADEQYPPIEQEDSCDTLLESLRMMCCCLLPETQQDLAKSTNTSSSSHPTSERKMQITKQRRTGGTVYGHVDESARFHVSQQIKLLPPILPEDQGKPCLVLDLDETLVHSSFRAVAGADFVIPVQIEDVVHYVYVAKRPGVDEFLVEMAKYYEIILYTASLNKYADPLLDLLDPHRTIRTRLFRESCVYYEGNYVKDLSLLDRDLSKTIIVDNSPSSYIFHPRNAIDCTSFIDDPTDVELDQIGSFLKDVRNVKDVRSVCGMWKEWPNINISAAEVETRQDKLQ